jgi:hypothetical protein
MMVTDQSIFDADLSSKVKVMIIVELISNLEALNKPLTAFFHFLCTLTYAQVMAFENFGTIL